jgi:S-DNA-T family DNA segregation ATPase FtsK/SpoIIIE
VSRDARNASIAHLTLLATDPFTARSYTSELATSQVSNLWAPITLGYDEVGSRVAVELAERNFLIGGEPGAGKSVGLNVITAAAALDPTVRLYLFDPKVVELAPWSKCADCFVTTDIDQALRALYELRAEMDRRYGLLAEHGKRKVTWVFPDTAELIVVVIDELALYTTHPDKAKRDAFAAALRDLVARGRAAGVIVVAATQKPAADTVPSSIRDLFSSRWAMRCTTREASDTILGSGWAAKGYSAADIDAATRGVGYLLHEGKEPWLMRACYLTDDEVHAIAARAARIREVREIPSHS